MGPKMDNVKRNTIFHENLSTGFLSPWKPIAQMWDIRIVRYLWILSLDY